MKEKSHQINFQIDRVRFKVNEIVKVGSLGHGTSVPGHFDIDLIIYSGGKYNAGRGFI